jgi:hypothetical protein
MDSGSGTRVYRIFGFPSFVSGGGRARLSICWPVVDNGYPLISASMGRLCASVLSVKTHLSCVSCTVMWLCGDFCFNHCVVEIEI